MLTDTLGAFGEGSATLLSSTQGLLLLEGWLNALRGDAGTERIQTEMEALRDHLRTGTPDTETIQQLLLNMASHTSTMADLPSTGRSTADQLRQLANAIRNFSSQF